MPIGESGPALVREFQKSRDFDDRTIDIALIDQEGCEVEYRYDLCEVRAQECMAPCGRMRLRAHVDVLRTRYGDAERYSGEPRPQIIDVVGYPEITQCLTPE